VIAAFSVLAQNVPPPTGPQPINIPHVDWISVAPETAIVATGMVLVLLAAINRGRRDLSLTYLVLSLAGIAVSFAFVAKLWNDIQKPGQAYEALSKMVAVDGFSLFLKVVILIATALAVLLADGFLRRERMERPEYLALMLFSASGMLIMASANDLIVVFLALEVLSIALYVLAAFDRRRLESQEAGLKYFVLGAFSSAFFLYGVALTYGATGTTLLPAIGSFLASNTLLHQGLLLGGFAFLLVGLGFKVAAVPFHFWTPDVYQGAPTPVTGFMAAGAKAAGFAALLRIFLGPFASFRVDWQPLVWALAVLTLVVGAATALVQDDIKRMLAYSSINHAGYVLIGLQAGSARGLSAALFYLLAYTVMVVGSFAVITVIGRRGDRAHGLDDYRGLASRQPVLAGALTLFLLAQAGVPLTGGFIAKLGVFAAAVEAHDYSLAIVGVLAAVIAAFFYLRVIVAMYMSGDPDSEPPRLRVDASTGLVLGIAAAFTVVLGVIPASFLDFAKHAHLLF
jgi:NADH-quinone oxidoreductase subunit N